MKKSAQRKNKKVAFRASILAVALASGFAQAAETQSQNLETVTVKAQAVTSTHRVTTKKLDESTSTDLKDVLFNEPSVSAGGGNGTAQWWTIRGMGQDQIDMKVDNTYNDTQMFHHNGRFLLDPALTKIVAVQKGTGSASAGIGATSGAIVAKTIDAKDLLREGQNVGFKVNAGYSSNKGYSRGATVYGRYAGLDALISGNWVKEKNYKDGNGAEVPLSGLGQRGLLAKFAYDINDNNRVTLSHRQEKTYGFRNLREEFAVVGNPMYRILTQDTTNLEYEGKNLGTLGNLTANVYNMKQERKEPATATSSGVTTVKTIGANIGFDTPILDKHSIKYGVNYRQQESSPASRWGTIRQGSNVVTVLRNTVNEEKKDAGVYVEGIWNFAPITLTTGLRYDYFKAKFSGNSEVSGKDFNPSVGVIYDVNQDLALKASYNFASRSPRLSEALLSGGTVYTVDPNLKAERSRNAEIGFTYKLNNSLDLDGSLFWQTIKNAQGTSNNVYVNKGTVKNNGYEFNAAYKWQGLTARAGVAYSKPKKSWQDGVAADRAYYNAIGRTWTTGLAYQFDNPNLELGWRGRFVQKVSESNVTRTGYGVNDIYVNWKPTGKDDLNVNFAVNNVGDKYYKSHSQIASTVGLPETGRDFRVNVNYRF